MHSLRYYGAYANRCRSPYRDEDGGVKPTPASTSTEDPLPKSRASWARLLRMVFDVDPLTCRHVRKKGVEAEGERFDARAPPAA